MSEGDDSDADIDLGRPIRTEPGQDLIETVGRARMLDGHRARARSGIALLRAAIDALETDLEQDLADRNSAQQVLTNAGTLALDIARLELLISQEVPE